MNEVMTQKVAVIDELKAKVDSTKTAVVTEYRGMTVAEISELRRTLRGHGADFKVFKNTLVRRAIAGTSVEPMTEFLEGPTAIAFGDVSAVAKTLRDFSKSTPTLVVKGGVLDGRVLSLKDLIALADLPSRDVLLAQLAGLIASPMRTMAGLMKAVPQSLAYGLSALIDSKGGAPVSATKTEEAEAPAPAEAEAEAPAAEATTEEAPEAASDEVTAEAEALAPEASEEAPAAE
jgi:large subunit ribosomal protein L10